MPSFYFERFQKQTFLTNGSWTAPQGVTKVYLYGCGGGGGGGGGSTSSGVSGGSGGQGASIDWIVVDVTPGISYSVVIGAGGLGGPLDGNGSNGGNTTFDTTLAIFRGGNGGFNLPSGSFNIGVLNPIGTLPYGSACYGGRPGGSSIEVGISGQSSRYATGGTGGNIGAGEVPGGGGGASFGAGGNGAGNTIAGTNADANSGGGGGGGRSGADTSFDGGSGRLYVFWEQP